MLKWLTLSLFAYLGVVIFAHVSWRDLGTAIVVPKVGFGGGELTTLVALFGTTISPCLFFWQAAEEAEDLHAYQRRRDLLHAPEQGSAALHRIEVDTLVGMAFSNLVALAIMVTARRGAAPAWYHRHPDLGSGCGGPAPTGWPVLGYCLRPWHRRDRTSGSSSAGGLRGLRGQRGAGPSASVGACWRRAPSTGRWRSQHLWAW